MVLHVIAVIAAAVVSALVAFLLVPVLRNVSQKRRLLAAVVVFAVVAASPQIWAKLRSNSGETASPKPPPPLAPAPPVTVPPVVPPGVGHGAAPGETLKVLLLPFDNRSGKPIAELGEKAKSALETFVFGLGGIQVVTRDQIPALQEESKLRAFYGDGDGTMDLVLVGADFVLTGVVLSYEVDRQEVEAYGVKNVKDHYRMGLTLRLVDARTGNLAFSKGFQAKHSDRYAQGAVPAQPVSRTLELLDDALAQGAEGLRQGMLAKP